LPCNKLPLTLYVCTVETGEEEEKTRFSCKAKLFHFSDGEWKERGLGTFKINVKEPKDPGKDKISARMIMRADGVLRVMLNTPIFKGMTVGDVSGEEPKGKQINLLSLDEGRSVPLLLRVSLSIIFPLKFSLTDYGRRLETRKLPKNCTVRYVICKSGYDAAFSGVSLECRVTRLYTEDLYDSIGGSRSHSSRRRGLLVYGDWRPYSRIPLKTRLFRRFGLINTRRK
jgi:hypothetical protein